MQLKNSYFYFKSAISPEQCKKIIDLGKSQIEEDKKRGIATHGTTGGNKEKQSLGDNAVPLNDKTYSELKNIPSEDIYVRDSEIAWLNDKWIYDLRRWINKWFPTIKLRLIPMQHKDHMK